MKAAVFFDIDGTLWNYDHFIPESTKRAIKELRANGHMAFLCSGRARAFINHPDLLGMGFDGVVCSCGCHIEVNEEVIFEHLIDKDLAVATVETLREHGFMPILEGPENLYMDDDEFPVGDGFGDILRRDLGDALVAIGGDNYGNWKINKMSCAMEVPQETIDKCYAILEKDFGIIAHNETVCEVVPKGYNKATGMLHACELVGIDPKNTYAFGDSENDLDMLKAAAVGVAMGNGTDNAKAAADYVTDAFDADGIYNGLKHFGLI